MSSIRSLRMRRDSSANSLNRRKNGQSIVCDTHLGPPSSWASRI
jgi:hypothetical protein